MLIVFEGADGCGKSTQARLLSEHFGIPIFKPVGSPLTGEVTVRESQAEDRGAMGVVQAIAGKTDIIFDRCFISEWAYAEAFSRDDVDRSLIHDMETVTIAIPHIVFHLPVRVDQAWFDERVGNDHEHEMSFDRWCAIVRGYGDYFDSCPSGMTVRHLGHSTVGGTHILVREAMRYMKERSAW